ncbi:MAG: hypothetical protein HFG26_10105 [Provencibacterium sp.]|jgi:membrane dipeptidase|nr:hypothetical protein [Provencibacterium sp.]
MRIFDLHCDTLTCCKKKGWTLENGENHLHLSDAEDFDSYIQLYAVFIPDEVRGVQAENYFSIHNAYYRRQLAESEGMLYDVHSLKTLERAAQQKGMSGILAVEGGSVLHGDLDMATVLANAGVRSLTLTWNSNNEIAGGVLDDGGLTAFGREAVAELERLRIAVDVSHLNDRSFWEVLDAASKPVIATHSNARSVCGHPRNLTGEMFDAIVEQGGLVGLNFARQFIAPDEEPADLAAMARHVVYFLERGGEDVLALGSDYDGAIIDGCIDRPYKLKNLYRALLENGVSEAQADKIFFGNAFRFFSRLYAGEL